MERRTTFINSVHPNLSIINFLHLFLGLVRVLPEIEIKAGKLYT